MWLVTKPAKGKKRELTLIWWRLFWFTTKLLRMTHHYYIRDLVPSQHQSLKLKILSCLLLLNGPNFCSFVSLNFNTFYIPMDTLQSHVWHEHTFPSGVIFQMTENVSLSDRGFRLHSSSHSSLGNMGTTLRIAMNYQTNVTERFNYSQIQINTLEKWCLKLVWL